MKAFQYLRPQTPEAAAQTLAGTKGALVHAGGVDLLDRMKERVDEPEHVVGLLDLEGDLRKIETTGSRLRIGALVTLAALADADAVPESLREAAGQAASPQLRHRATLGGNLAQHTRCGYYRHASFPCWKRGDDLCPVRGAGGVQEMAAIFDNASCASAHPSSLAPVLGSLGAVIAVLGPKGERTVPFEAFWADPKKGVTTDTTLGPGDLVTHVEIDAPGPERGRYVAYGDVRQKASFDWPLVSCAVHLVRKGDGIGEASVWLGSVAPTPRRAKTAEALLHGPVSAALFEEAAAAAAEGATPLDGTSYKIPLVKVVVRRALGRAWERP